MHNNQKIQVICLPYSGGSSFAYQPLVAYFPKHWKVTTVLLSGRGKRIGEPLVYTMDELVEDSWQQIKGHLQTPYVFFGHSLGSTLAYLLVHKAKNDGQPLPLHLFLSGTDGPAVPIITPLRYLFSKTDFKKRLNSYGGISLEILNDKEVFDFFEPIIRADFQAIETWKYTEKPRLTIPTTVITGIEEDLIEENIQQWQKEFTNTIRFHKMPGNHFFLFEQAQQFVGLMEKHLSETLSKQVVLEVSDI